VIKWNASKGNGYALTVAMLLMASMKGDAGKKVNFEMKRDIRAQIA
jgi:hypothetical protein